MSSQVAHCSLSPQIHTHVEPWDVTLLGNKVFAEVMKRRRSHTGQGGPSVQCLGTLLEERAHRDTGRGWSDASTSPGTLRTAWSHQELEESRGAVSLRATRGTTLQHLDWTSGLLKYERTNVCFQPPHLRSSGASTGVLLEAVHAPGVAFPRQWKADSGRCSLQVP